MRRDRRARRAILVMIALAAMVLAAACDREPRGDASPVATKSVSDLVAPSSTRTAAPTGTTMTIIDWVDLVRLNGIDYGPLVVPGRRITIEEDRRGPRYGEVAHRLEGSVTDPSYRIQDGDATFLDEGTVLFEVRGYAPEFRIAAEQDGQLLLYEVDSNPNATVGSDLLDISGRVTFITIDSELDLSEVARIEDPDEVARLVDLVTAASVDHDPPPHADLRRFITFHLADGTSSTRVFWLETGEMGRGIMTAPEFGESIEAAVDGS